MVRATQTVGLRGLRSAQKPSLADVALSSPGLDSSCVPRCDPRMIPRWLINRVRLVR